jgi:hypothetical protein
MKTKNMKIDILTVIDPVEFENNSLPLTTPIDDIPNISYNEDPVKNNVRMIAEHGSVNDRQATSNIEIKARGGDVIRWWDTSIVQDTDHDMIIVGFQKGTNWDVVMEDVSAKTRGVGRAYIKSGFDMKNLSHLQFASNSFQNNYIQATVKENAPIGTTSYYYLVVAKLDVSKVNDVKLKGLYRFDPSITVIK